MFCQGSMKFYLNVRDFFSLKHGANKYLKVKAVASFLGKIHSRVFHNI